MRRFNQLFLVLVAVAVSSAACSSSNPAGPTPGGSGATINGAIVSQGGSATKHSGTGGGSQTVPGLVVSVAGTNISSVVNSADEFSLRGVPSGSVELRFSAPSLNASLSLGAVQSAETVEIGVVISGSTVTLESQRRQHGNETELEGRVEGLPPTTPALTFIVAGRPVTTNASTQFSFHGDERATFADLAIGMRVHVKGQRNGDSLLATIVKIQNTRGENPVSLRGTIRDLSGTPAAFQFTLGEAPAVSGVIVTLVKGDANTEFGDDGRFADLANGKRVEVKGQLRNGFVYAQRIHFRDGDDDEGEEVEFDGLLTSIVGASPNLSLVVGGRTVKTNQVTKVYRRDMEVGLSALAVGQTLEVEGRRQTDGSILLKKIEIEGNDDDDEIRGTLTSKIGTSPLLTLVVGGHTVKTNGSTEVRRGAAHLDLSALAVGQTLEVEVRRLDDGSLLAREIHIVG